MINVASRIKKPRAPRATLEQMEHRRDVVFDICSQMNPITVRGAFYQASSNRLIVPKDESGYEMVQRCTADLRRKGRIPYGWITDSTRLQRKPRTYRNTQQALLELAAVYRRQIWDALPVYAEVWIEKDALSSVVYPVTSEFDVPLMVARGYSSLTFLHAAAEQITEIGKPTYIYHLGDYDPSGVDAARKIERELREFAKGMPITFQRLAVLPDQITAWNLPTRRTKTSDSRSKGFGEISVELDAIDPIRLRQLVRDAIEQHIPHQQLEVMRAAEESEREFFEELARYA